MKGCDTCGAPTDTRVNGVRYCPEHFRAGLAVQARLTAYQSDAPSDVIAFAGDWAEMTAAEVIAEFGPSNVDVTVGELRKMGYTVTPPEGEEEP